MRNHLRRWLQRYLGLTELPTKANLAELESAARNRHAELLKLQGEASERLGRLENVFISQHVPKRTAPSVQDWEQVQMEELAYMLANPQKEDS